MIARIRGELVEVGPGYVIVMSGDVGYQVYLSERGISALPGIGSEIDIPTRQIVRENELSLYGFQSISERRTFDLLMTVSGLGPKLALGMIGKLGHETVISAILSNNVRTLTEAPGVGAKLAERIRLDLQDKLSADKLLGLSVNEVGSETDDVIEALVTLGHKRHDAQRAVVAARKEANTDEVNVLIPIALRYAGKK
jgi:Holliday junction DNA helicase RuvA